MAEDNSKSKSPITPKDSADANLSKGAQAQGQQTQTQKPAPYPTVEQVVKMCPGAPPGDVAKHLPILLKHMVKAGLVSRNQLIGMLATVYTETTSFRPVPEVGKGGGAHGIWYGRGYIQLTHDYNYRAAGKALGYGDQLLNNPDRVLESEIAAQTTIWYWTTQASCKAEAEAGNWSRLRKAVNAGNPGFTGHVWGMDTFLAAVDRGLKIFNRGIDPNALDLTGRVDGHNDWDTGSGSSRVISGGLNPSTTADALSIALGLHMRDRQNMMEFEDEINAAQIPEILKLKGQNTFEIKGVQKEFVGTWTVDEYIIRPLKAGVPIRIFANKEDPSLPKVQGFADPNELAKGGAGSGVNSDTTGTNGVNSTRSTVAPASGSLQDRIAAAARRYRGSSTAGFSGGGNVACVYAVNNVFTLANISRYPSEAVEGAINEMVAGRATEIPASQTVPGDIMTVLGPASGHIGVIVSPGRVLSNSSSRQAYVWESDLQFDGYYSNVDYKYWRMKS